MWVCPAPPVPSPTTAARNNNVFDPAKRFYMSFTHSIDYSGCNIYIYFFGALFTNNALHREIKTWKIYVSLVGLILIYLFCKLKNYFCIIDFLLCPSLCLFDYFAIVSLSIPILII